MKRVLFASLAASAAILTGCATETVPACRAPASYEMEAFRAIMSHDRAALANATAPGPLRDAVSYSDPAVTSHVWGSQGITRGSVTGLLARPPLCILDDMRTPPTDAMRQILVYPQENFDRVAPLPETPLVDAPPPYGVARRDYLSCRFEQTASGWKLADLCGYTRPVAPVNTGAR
ncbi:hypothetical protein [Maricaulis parjimensis]|uniref:hypothetical protein n=1 Tax=Maricaulis parjimensis TaxID=144023 RepID=UPI00193ADC3F|nr:hypothetical protein [Maricaulis parjimensis]